MNDGPPEWAKSAGKEIIHMNGLGYDYYDLATVIAKHAPKPVICWACHGQKQVDSKPCKECDATGITFENT